MAKHPPKDQCVTLGFKAFVMTWDLGISELCGPVSSEAVRTVSKQTVEATQNALRRLGMNDDVRSRERHCHTNIFIFNDLIRMHDVITQEKTLL